MQLNKNNHYQDNSLFPQHLFIQQILSPHQYPPNHTTTPSPPNQEEHSPVSQHIQTNMGSVNPSQLRFYPEYKKIYTISHHLTLEKARQIKLMNNLVRRIKTLEDKMKEGRDRDMNKKDSISDQNKAKRSRRTAEQIEKKYKCQVAYCERFYGSQGSLQQHIKLKHPQLYHKSEIDDSLQGNNESFI